MYIMIFAIQYSVIKIGEGVSMIFFAFGRVMIQTMQYLLAQTNIGPSMI